MRVAEQGLVARGHRAATVRTWLSPVEALIVDDEFWRFQSDGLALFAAPEFFRLYRLPLRFEESVVVTERFHISPLLPYFTDDERFYVLALSQQGCRLLHCSRHRVAVIELPGAPPSMTETSGYERRETQLQFEAIAPRGGSGTSSGGGTALFHGHGSAADASTADLERYFRAVDRVLCDRLRECQDPLLLAGVEYLLPLYRSLSHYQPIVSESVTGNHEGRSAEELHRDAWRVMEPRFDAMRRDATALVQEAVATGRGSDRLDDIVPAAVQGRVELLLAPVDRVAWGRFDPDTQRAEAHAEQRPADEDLYELTAVQTFLHGGRVLPAEGGQPLAARFRY